MFKYKLGGKPSPPDPRDYRFGDIGGATKLEPYHSDYKDRIINQLQSMQCGACAIVAARAETEYKQNGNTNPFSHTFVYGSDTDLNGEGMYMRTIMKIALSGIPYETAWESWGDKSECKKLVRAHKTDELMNEAHHNRESSYYSCSTWQDVCKGVSLGGEGLILVEIYDNWGNAENGEIGKNKGAYCGNHFLRVKDYEILKGGTLKIRCQNSWGEEWGDNGYCYLYSNVHDFLEARVLIDDVEEVKRKLKFKDVKDTDWYKKAVDYVSDKGIMQGFEDGTFRPDEPLTRAQAAQILYAQSKNSNKE